MGKGDAWIRPFLAVRTKYRERRAQFLGLQQRALLVPCAWWQRRLGWKRTQAAVPGATRQSIGPRYAADIVTTLALLTDALTPAAYGGWLAPPPWEGARLRWRVARALQERCWQRHNPQHGAGRC